MQANRHQSDPNDEGGFVSVNGLNIYYREIGEGRPLILLHGATDTHKLWVPHLAGLVDNYRVITPDSRGHGRTLNPSRELSYQLMADDLAGLIIHLKLEKPYIFGYSDGGQAVLDFGMRHPDLAGALVIGGAWYRFSEEYQSAITKAGFVEPGVVDWEIYHRQAPPDWEKRIKAVHLDPDPNYPRIMLESLARLWWTPLNYSVDDFMQISAPTMIIMAELDEMIPLQEAEEMAAMIPDAELEVISNASHNDVLKPGGEFLKQLIRFLSNIR